MEQNKPQSLTKVIIEVSGGLVLMVHSTTPLEFIVIDHDVDHGTEVSLVTKPDSIVDSLSGLYKGRIRKSLKKVGF